MFEKNGRKHKFPCYPLVRQEDEEGIQEVTVSLATVKETSVDSAVLSALDGIFALKDVLQTSTEDFSGCTVCFSFYCQLALATI